MAQTTGLENYEALTSSKQTNLASSRLRFAKHNDCGVLADEDREVYYFERDAHWGSSILDVFPGLFEDQNPRETYHTGSVPLYETGSAYGLQMGSEDQVSLYAESVLNSRLAYCLYPDENMTSYEGKTIAFSDVIRCYGDVMIVNLPHSPAAYLGPSVFVRANAAQDWVFWKRIAPSQNLATTFSSIRQVNGSLSLLSASVTGTTYEVSGNLIAIQLNELPALVSQGPYTMSSYAAESHQFSGMLPVTEGSHVIDLPATDNDYVRPRTAGNRDGRERTVYYNEVAGNASAAGWIAPSTDLDSDALFTTVPISGAIPTNCTGRVRYKFCISGITASSDGVLATITLNYRIATSDSDWSASAQTDVTTHYMIFSSDAQDFEFSGLLTAGDAWIESITILCSSALSSTTRNPAAASKCSVEFAFLDYEETDNKFGNVTFATALGTAQELIVDGVRNFQCVPDATTQQNVKTTAPYGGLADELQQVHHMLASSQAAHITACSLRRYREAIDSGIVDKIANFRALQTGSFFNKLKKGVRAVSRVVKKGLPFVRDAYNIGKMAAPLFMGDETTPDFPAPSTSSSTKPTVYHMADDEEEDYSILSTADKVVYRCADVDDDDFEDFSMLDESDSPVTQVENDKTDADEFEDDSEDMYALFSSGVRAETLKLFKSHPNPASRKNLDWDTTFVLGVAFSDKRVVPIMIVASQGPLNYSLRNDKGQLLPKSPKNYVSVGGKYFDANLGKANIDRASSFPIPNVYSHLTAFVVIERIPLELDAPLVGSSGSVACLLALMGCSPDFMITGSYGVSGVERVNLPPKMQYAKVSGKNLLMLQSPPGVELLKKHGHYSSCLTNPAEVYVTGLTSLLMLAEDFYMCVAFCVASVKEQIQRVAPQLEVDPRVEEVMQRLFDLGIPQPSSVPLSQEIKAAAKAIFDKTPPNEKAKLQREQTIAKAFNRSFGQYMAKSISRARAIKEAGQFLMPTFNSVNQAKQEVFKGPGKQPKKRTKTEENQRNRQKEKARRARQGHASSLAHHELASAFDVDDEF